MISKLQQRVDARTRGASGFTLIELLVEMAILFTVLTAVTTLFVSASKSELYLNAQFQAQQQARLAVNRMRGDIHCARVADQPGSPPAQFVNFAGTPERMLRLTLPPQCLETAGDASIFYYTSRLSASPPRYELRRQQTFPFQDIRLADYLTVSGFFSLPTPSPGTLTKVYTELPVNVRLDGTGKEWRLVSEVALRNGPRA